MFTFRLQDVYHNCKKIHQLTTKRASLKGRLGTMVKLLPCDHEVQVLKTVSYINAEKDCVHKTQSRRTLSQTRRKRELRAPGCPNQKSIVEKLISMK
jgi:hypothetical protein